MPTLQWSVSPASPVPAGTECMLTLRLDPGAAVLGAASLRLAIPDSGFTVISVTPLAFAGAQDIFEVQAPAAPLAPYVVACARTDGTAGAVDVLSVACTATGWRGHTYRITADLVDAVTTGGEPLALGSAEIFVATEAGAVAVLDLPLDRGFATVPYRALLRAEGGTPPYAWDVSAGTLPAGLTLGASGALEGTAIGPANEIVTFRVTDAAAGVATRALRVRMQHSPLAITTASLGRAAPGHEFETVLTSTGGKSPIRWEASHQPAGVSISGTRLRGTPELDPARFGSLMVTLTATDSDDPPQRAIADVPLAFVPALNVQQIAVASPGAVLVARDLCLVNYAVTASASAVETYRDEDFEATMADMQDAVIGAMAELIFEIMESDDPLARQRYRDEMAVLVDLYRDVEVHRNTSVDAAISLFVSVDDQRVKQFHFGGYLPPHRRRAYAGRPLLSYREPRSKRARDVRALLQRDGRRMRAFARGVFDAALEERRREDPRDRTPRPRFLMQPPGGSGLITYGVGSILQDLELGGFDISRWLRDVFELPEPDDGTILLTPGAHVVTVEWDGYVIHVGRVGPYGEMVGRSSRVSFEVTFDPANPNGWPRLNGTTRVAGGGGLSGTTRQAVSLANSGLDLLVSSAAGLQLMPATGKSDEPYAAATPYPVQPTFTPQRLRDGVIDPYGRTSVFLHSNTHAAAIVNHGPAGLTLASVPLQLDTGESIADVDRGGAASDGWRSLHLVLGPRRARIHRDDLRRTIEGRPLPAPSYYPLDSSIRNDRGTCIALLESGDGAFASMIAGFEVDGSVLSLDDQVTMHAGGTEAQPISLLSGTFAAAVPEFAAALRQGRELRLWRWQAGQWTVLPPVALPVRPWELAPAPGDARGLAIGATMFGAVLVVTWSAPDATPVVLCLHSAAGDVRMSGAGGVLAIAEAQAGTIAVYR